MRYQVNSSLVTREIAGELLAVPVGTMTQRFNGMVTFSESGQLLWKALAAGPKTESELVAVLLENYDCSQEQASEDVIAFLDALVSKALISEAI